jgi:hypothetical protein
LRQVLEIGNTLVLVNVFSAGTKDVPKLHVSVSTDRPLSKSVISSAGNLVSSIFYLSEDITPFYRAMKQDAIMAGPVRQLRELVDNVLSVLASRIKFFPYQDTEIYISPVSFRKS